MKIFKKRKSPWSGKRGKHIGNAELEMNESLAKQRMERENHLKSLRNIRTCTLEGDFIECVSPYCRPDDREIDRYTSILATPNMRYTQCASDLTSATSNDDSGESTNVNRKDGKFSENNVYSGSGYLTNMYACTNNCAGNTMDNTNKIGDLPENNLSNEYLTHVYASENNFADDSTYHTNDSGIDQSFTDDGTYHTYDSDRQRRMFFQKAVCLSSSSDGRADYISSNAKTDCLSSDGKSVSLSLARDKCIRSCVSKRKNNT